MNMNRLLHCVIPAFFSFSLGLALGYGFRCREVKKLKNFTEQLKDILEQFDDSPIEDNEGEKQ